MHIPLAACPSSDNHYLFKFLKDFVFFSLLVSGFLNADDGPPVCLRNHHALKDPEINMLTGRTCNVPSAIDQSSF